jgi:cytoskeleton protein RodZ
MTTEIPEQPIVPEPSGSAALPKAGELLLTARLALGLSVQDVASKMRLKPLHISALEEDEYEVIGSPVFVRGHLRTYAKLVNLDEDQVIAAYDRDSPAVAVVTDMTSFSRQVHKEAHHSRLKWVSWGVLLLVVVLLALWWWQDRQQRRPASSVEVSTPATVSLSPYSSY